MGWYLTDREGQCVFEATLEECFEELTHENSDTEDPDPLYGPIRERCQNEGGGFEIHPEGIRAPGATYQVAAAYEEEVAC